MSATEEIFKGNSYEVVAWARGQEVLLYETYGGYQGEWIMLSRADGVYYLWKDNFGSCSGCDAYEAWGVSEATKSQALEFAKDYQHFIEIPADTMERLCANRTLAAIMPANIREDYSDLPPLEQLADDMIAVSKLAEGWPVTIDDVLKTNNAETKRRVLEVFGHERFVQESGAETVATEGENTLLKVTGELMFVYLKDSSTPRRYLLRVPP